MNMKRLSALAIMNIHRDIHEYELMKCFGNHEYS